jgi:septal ring factor EnvC (AmiA/AmiB activator)
MAVPGISISSFLTSLRTPRGVALTSLDKYLAEPATTRRETADATPADDAAETIASLQREHQRLTEELNSERHRSETLKSAFSKSLTEAADRNRQKLARLRTILEADDENATVQRALLLIADTGAPSRAAPPESPRVKELIEAAHAAEAAVARQSAQNQNCKDEIRALSAARDERAQHLEDVKAQIEAQRASRQQLKEKLKNMAAHFKKGEAEWKEKMAQLDAEIEDRNA